MKRVVQISLDIEVEDNVDGVVLAEEVADTLEENGYIVKGSSFQDDMTEYYSE